MPNKLSIGVSVLVLGLIAYAGYDYYQALSAKQAKIEASVVEMKELQDGNVRAQAKFVEDIKDAAKAEKIDLKQIQKDLNRLDATVKAFNVVSAVTPGYYGTHLPSTSTKPENPNPPPKSQDPYGHLTNSQTLNLNEPLSNGKQVPFGSATFKAWEPRPWTNTVYPREYKVTTVLGMDEEGRHYTYNKFQVISNKQTVDVPVTSAKFVEEYPKSKLRFSPRLYLSVDVGAYVQAPPAPAFMPSAQLSFFSVGKTKVNPTVSILGIGVGYESQQRKPNLIVNPFSYNVAEGLPFVENLFLGPAVAVNLDKSFTVTAGVRVGL